MTDVGQKLFCRVTATNASGSALAFSNVVGPVVAAAGGGGGTFAYLADAEGQGNDSIAISAIDTTGAGLLIIALADYTGVGTVSDSKGNTWATEAADGNIRIFYSYPTTVGIGHTVTVSNATPPMYASACFAAFSGGAAGGLDDDSHAVAGSGSTAAAGSITPSQNNSLIISVVYILDALTGATSVDSGFTKICDLPRGGQIGLSVGYLIQTTAAAVNPSWTCPGTGSWQVRNVVFSSSALVTALPAGGR